MGITTIEGIQKINAALDLLNLSYRLVNLAGEEFVQKLFNKPLFLESDVELKEEIKSLEDSKIRRCNRG